MNVKVSMGLLTLMGLSVLVPMTAFAEQPSIDEVKGMVGTTWTGSLQQVNGHKDDENDEWQKYFNKGGHCQIKILSDKTVWVRTNGWRMHRQAVLKAGFGHSGGNPKAPVTFGGADWSVYEQSGGALDPLDDNGVVRLVWNSPKEVEFQWWPSPAAQAGQLQHKPPHVSGILRR